MTGADEREEAGPSGGRKLAEWVTMGLSVVLVLGTVGYLVYLGLRGDPPLVPVQITVLADQSREKAGRYVVPVEVRNQGQRTLKNLKVRLSQRTAGGREEAGDLTIDYLGERATATVYVYLNKDPREQPLEVEPSNYQLE